MTSARYTNSPHQPPKEELGQRLSYSRSADLTEPCPLADCNLMKLAPFTEQQLAEALGRRGPYSSLLHSRNPAFLGFRASFTTSPEAGMGVALLPVSSSVTREGFLEPPPPEATAGRTQEELYFGSILQKTKAIHGQRGSFTLLAGLTAFVLCPDWCVAVVRCTAPRQRADLTEPALSLRLRSRLLQTRKVVEIFFPRAVFLTKIRPATAGEGRLQ